VITRNSNVRDPKINTNETSNFRDFRFFGFNRSVEIPATSTEDQFGFTLLMFKLFKLQRSSLVRDQGSARTNHPDRNRLILLVPTQYPGIVSYRSTMPENPQRFLIFPVSIGNFRDAADHDLCRQWKTISYIAIRYPVELEPRENLLRKRYFGDLVDSLVSSLQSFEKLSSLLLGRFELNLGNRVHRDHRNPEFTRVNICVSKRKERRFLCQLKQAVSAPEIK
jgi:hypothetical protein